MRVRSSLSTPPWMTRDLVGPRLVLHEIEDIVERIPVFREQQYLLVGLFFEQLLDVSTYFLGLRVDRDSLSE